MGIETAVLIKIFTKIAIAATLSFVAHVLSPRPDLRSRNRESNITIREPDSPRRIVYGESRVGTIVGDIFTDQANIHAAACSPMRGRDRECDRRLL